MATEVKMPQLGETVVEGTITRWLKQVGESVGVDEPLVEVSTDKVDSEIPSPAGGTIARIHAAEGETVRVGSVIAEIAAAGEVMAPSPPPAAKPAASEPAPVPAPPPAAAAAAPAGQPQPAPAAVPAPPPAPPAPRLVPVPSPVPSPALPAAAHPAPAIVAPAATVLPSGDGTEPLRGVLSPIVRRIAAERGIDLSTVHGTGTGGRITKQDVLNAPPAPPAPAVPAAVAPAAAAPLAQP
ncbi:MAG: biotin/lipoyl-containing protein, partial [Actinomycetota bacterium]